MYLKDFLNDKVEIVDFSLEYLLAFLEDWVAM